MGGQKDVKFTVSAEDKASASLKAVEKALGGLEDAAKNLLEKLGVLLGAAAFGEFFKGAVENAVEAQRSWSTLANSIGNVGGAFDALKPKIEATVAALASTSRFRNDELVQGLERLTTTSGDAARSINNLQLVANIAAERHMDLETAATLVGKVMQGNTTALKKFGLVVQEGDDAIALLQGRFKGFAEKDAETFGGQLKMVRNRFEDLQEEVGNVIIGNKALGDGLGDVVKFFATLEGWVRKHEEGLGELTTAIATVAGWLGTGLMGAFTLAVGGFMGFNLLVETTVFLFAQVYEGGKVAFGGLSKVIGEWLEASAGFFEKFGIHVDGVGEKLANFGTKMMNEGLANQRRNRDTLAADAGKVSDFVANGFGSGEAAKKIPAPDGGGGSGPPREDRKAVEALRLELARLNEETASGKPKWQQFQESIDQWVRKAKDAHMSTKELDAGVASLNATLGQIKQQEADKAFADLTARMMEMTGSAMQKLDAQLDVEVRKLRELSTEIADPQKRQAFLDLINQYKGLREASNTFSLELDAAKASFTTLGETISEHRGNLKALQADEQTAQDAVTRWHAAVDDSTLSADNHKKAVEALKEAKRLLAEAVAGEAEYWKLNGQAMADATAEADKHRKHIADLAAQYAGLARSAIAGAQAIGQLSAESAAALQNVVSLGEGVAKIFASGGTDIAAWAQSISSLAGLIQQLSGANKAEQIAAQKVMYENTVALHKLAESLGLLGRGVAGNDIPKALDQMQYLMVLISGRKDEQKAPSFPSWIDDAFLKGLAKQLGITIDDTAGSWRELNKALQEASGHLAQFGTDLASQMSLGTAATHFFGLTGADAMQAQLGSAVGMSPILQQIFGGQSISGFLGGGGSPQDAIKGILDVFKQMQAGTISDKNLGGLTGQQLLDTLMKLFDGMNSLVPPAATLSDAMAKLRNHFTLFGTSAGDQLTATLAKMGEFSPALKGIADGLDLTTTEGLVKLEERLKALYQTAEDGGVGLDLGKLSITELMQALQDLMRGAKTAAGGITSAAQAIQSAALALLNQSFDVHQTGSLDQAKAIAKNFGFGDLKLDTQADRDAADAYLQGLFDTTTDPAMRSAIQQVLHAIRAVQNPAGAGGSASPGPGAGALPFGYQGPVPGGLAGAVPSSSASSSGLSSSFSALTTMQGDQLVDLQRSMRDGIIDLVATAREVVKSMSRSGAAPAGQGGLQIGAVNVDVISDGNDPREIGGRIADEFIREVNIKLGQNTDLASLFRGTVGRRK